MIVLVDTCGTEPLTRSWLVRPTCYKRTASRAACGGSANITPTHPRRIMNRRKLTIWREPFPPARTCDSKQDRRPAC